MATSSALPVRTSGPWRASTELDCIGSSTCSDCAPASRCSTKGRATTTSFLKPVVPALARFWLTTFRRYRSSPMMRAAMSMALGTGLSFQLGFDVDDMREQDRHRAVQLRPDAAVDRQAVELL